MKSLLARRGACVLITGASGTRYSKGTVYGPEVGCAWLDARSPKLVENVEASSHDPPFELLSQSFCQICTSLFSCTGRQVTLQLEELAPQRPI